MKDRLITDETAGAERPDRKKHQHFISHAVIYGLGSISVQLVSICLLPVYTHTFSPAEYGILQLIYRVGDVLNICLMVNGVRLATLNFWGKANSESEQQHIAASVTVFTALVLGLGAIFVLGGSRYLGESLGIFEHQLLACGVLAIMLQATTAMPLALMQARLESTWFVVSTLLISVSQMTLVIIALLVLRWGVWGVILALATTHGCFGVALTWRELRRSSFLPHKDQMWGLARFAVPLIPGGLCFMLLHNGDQFFLLKHFGPATLGVYALGYRITKGAVLLASLPLMQVWSARMYDIYKRPGREVVFGQAFTRMMGAFLLAGTAVVVLRDEVLQILGPASFAGAGAVIATLLFAHFFLVLSNLLDGAFYVTRRTVLKSYIAAGSTCVMVLAYWLIIPRYGAQGAAVATLVGFVFHCGLTLVVSRQVFRIEIEYERLAVMLLLSTGIALASRWLGSGVSVLPLKVLLVLAWPCVLWNTRFVLAEERAYVRKEFSRVVTWAQRGVNIGATTNESDECEEASTLITSGSSASAKP